MTNEQKKAYKIFGQLLFISGIAAAWIFFTWKLALVLFLIEWSRNISKSK